MDSKPLPTSQLSQPPLGWVLHLHTLENCGIAWGGTVSPDYSNKGRMRFLITLWRYWPVPEAQMTCNTWRVQELVFHHGALVLVPRLDDGVDDSAWVRGLGWEAGWSWPTGDLDGLHLNYVFQDGTSIHVVAPITEFYHQEVENVRATYPDSSQRIYGKSTFHQQVSWDCWVREGKSASSSNLGRRCLR